MKSQFVQSCKGFLDSLTALNQMIGPMPSSKLVAIAKAAVAEEAASVETNGAKRNGKPVKVALSGKAPLPMSERIMKVVNEKFKKGEAFTVADIAHELSISGKGLGPVMTQLRLDGAIRKMRRGKNTKAHHPAKWART